MGYVGALERSTQLQTGSSTARPLFRLGAVTTDSWLGGLARSQLDAFFGPVLQNMDQQRSTPRTRTIATVMVAGGVQGIMEGTRAQRCLPGREVL